MTTTTLFRKAIKLCLSLLFLVLTSALSAQTTTYISSGSTWRYYDFENKPANQGSTSWYTNSYNHTNWNSGNAHLGYGDNDENTLVNNNAYTVYFRRTFSVNNVAASPVLKIELTYDDGAVIYINGTEAARVNMPSGSPGYETFTGVSNGDNALETILLANTLQNGTNTIAVEIHQKKATSSDLSFDLKLSGTQNNTGPTAEIDRGPYLQKASATSMVIKWRTEDPAPSILNYGTNQGTLDETYTNYNLTEDHEVELTGLIPNTFYYYGIQNATSEVTDLTTGLYFKTSPPVGTPAPMRAWILGDCGTQNNAQRSVRDAFYNYNNGQHVDMLLFLGDNAYGDGTNAQYQFSLFEDMYEDQLKQSVAWSCVGNHDIVKSEAATQTGTYYDIFTFPKQGESGGVASGTETYYSYDFGNIHYIVLDSYGSDREIDGPQYQWLEMDLQNTVADWIVAYWHHPPYCAGSVDSDNSGTMTDMRENFVPLLESYGVDLVLGGHSHTYERSHLIHGHYGDSDTFDEDENFVGAAGDGNGRLNEDGAYQKTNLGTNAGEGAVYLISGTAGKLSGGPLDHPTTAVAMVELGSCLLEISGNQMDVTFIRENGSIQDYFTLQKELATCIAGTPCNDNNVCTVNDVLDENCGCNGIFQDSDADGICDADDLCPQFDDTLIGTPCDDENPATENDVFSASSCTCQGTIPPPPASDCNVTLTVDGNDLIISGFSTTNRTLVKIYDSNWDSAYKCNYDCDQTPVIEDLPDDVYRVRVMELDQDWNFICEVNEDIIIGNGGNLQSEANIDHLFFQADKAAAVVQLNWVINTAYKSSYFEIEHSLDGIQFNKVDQVSNNFNSLEYLNYTHQLSAVFSGENHFRIKQFFYDGSHQYSNIQTLSFDEKSGGFTVFPNPTAKVLFADLRTYAGETGSIQLSNMLGEIVFEQEIVSVPNEPIQFDVSRFGAGVYTLSVNLKNRKEMSQLIIVSQH